MNMFIMAIRDSALDAFDRPFFVPALGLAERAFGDDIQSPESYMHKHPGDFTLYQLGTFETETGTFVTHDAILISRGDSHVQK